jgi:hypothetical protein
VLYVGTFSKVLFPTLRLGYLVVPPAFQDVFTAAKILSDFQSSSIDQCVLADFLKEGHLEPYVRKMRIIYGRRRALLVESLRSRLGNKVKIYGDEAGMHFVVDFQSSLSEVDAFNRILAAGVRVERLYWPGGSGVTIAGHVQFVLAFAATGEEDLVLAAERIGGALMEWKRAHVWPSDASATVQNVARNVGVFLAGGFARFLLGVFEKTGRKTWCFGGEFVALCMVSVVVEQPYLGPWKYDTSSGFIFWDSCFGNDGLERRSIDLGGVYECT